MWASSSSSSLPYSAASSSPSSSFDSSPQACSDAPYKVPRVICIMLLATLFIVQQVLHRLVTVWVTIGEFLHCVSYLLLVELFATNKGLKGISAKTQVAFLLVHWLRYVDSIVEPSWHQNTWIWCLKLFFMFASLLVVFLLIYMRHSYERQKDTCSMLLLVTSSFVLGCINYLVDKPPYPRVIEHVMHYFWEVSHYLQGFAMLPQFIFCYRDPDNHDSLLFWYVFVLGSYRLMYAFNWIQRYYSSHFFYVSGPLGLGILVVFLADFLLYKLRKKSCIQTWVLRLDASVDSLQQPLLSSLYGTTFLRGAAGDPSGSPGPSFPPPGGGDALALAIEPLGSSMAQDAAASQGRNHTARPTGELPSTAGLPTDAASLPGEDPPRPPEIDATANTNFQFAPQNGI
eukprot:GHVT01088877.1.p1 GENE.GHVT01088877.1~~GHVT01088877.1.p1  ORF type:complete len:400 (+),score=75.39 GHVT01088877.1:764-1963(+)